MKTISKLTFIFLFMGLVTTTMYAQQPGGGQRTTPEERAKTQTEALVKELVLTGEQRVKVDSINLRYARLSQQALTNASGDREAMRRVMTENQTRQTAAIKAFLTAEQIAKYDKWLADQPQPQMQQRPGGGGGGGNR